jgi:uncharacterized membrane protein HdeD (DUF308 family)
MIYPDMSIKIISYLIACILIAAGITLIVSYGGSVFLTGFLSTGILAIILGIIIFIYPNSLAIIIPIVVGIWMITSSVVNMQMALSLRKAGYSNWLLAVILAIITIACGILIIINPNSGATALTEFFGIMLIIYSISDIIDIIIFKNNVNDIIKLLN